MKIIGLQHPEYISVEHEGKASYGGGQIWFAKDKKLSRDYMINKWGCGAIAVGDLFLYLAKSDREFQTPTTSVARTNYAVLPWEDYKNYIHYIATMYAQIMPGSGMNGVAVASAVRRYCLKYHLSMTIAWKGFMDEQQMLRAMRKMLKEDLPVILSVGPNTPLVFRGKGIPFYILNDKEEFVLSPYRCVHSHFVVVTGIVGLKHRQVMLRVSSWGKEYYIDYKEYRKYIEEEGDTLTSSLLYLSKEDGTLF